MEKARKKELLENFCCKEVIFAILCIIACVVLSFVRARFPAGTVIRAALGVVEANVGLLAILVLFLSAPPTRRWRWLLYAAIVFEAVALAGIGIAVAAGAALDVVTALNLINIGTMCFYVVACIGGTVAMVQKAQAGTRKMRNAPLSERMGELVFGKRKPLLSASCTVPAFL